MSIGALAESFLELLLPSVCPACDAPRRPGVPRLCARCRPGLLALDNLGDHATCVSYARTGAALVQRFKFEGRRDALSVLLTPLGARARRLAAQNAIDGIALVPRARGRIRSQGRDPVWELGRALARETGLPLESRALGRRGAAGPQTGLPLRLRRDNVRGAFLADSRVCAGRRLLLLDDVTTTGATLREARRALETGGRAERVVPLALAGTPPVPSGPRSAL